MVNIEEKVKEKEELELDLLEIKAYRDLQGERFKFGGRWVEASVNASDIHRYKKVEKNIKEKIESLNQEIHIEKETRRFLFQVVSKCSCKGLKRSKRKKQEFKKLEKAYKEGSYFVTRLDTLDVGGFCYSRFYISGKKSYLKKRSNKIIRHSDNDFNMTGSSYKKKFDIKRELY